VRTTRTTRTSAVTVFVLMRTGHVVAVLDREEGVRRESEEEEEEKDWTTTSSSPSLLRSLSGLAVLRAISRVYAMHRRRRKTR
jgi:hypothetical protein